MNADGPLSFVIADANETNDIVEPCDGVAVDEKLRYDVIALEGSGGEAELVEA